MAKLTTKKINKTKKENLLEVSLQFPCSIYLIEKPEFLNIVKEVSEEALDIVRKKQEINEIYPVLMSSNYYDDPRLSDFSEFVGATAWNILEEQGYDVQDLSLSFKEMWTQEHHKHSSMDQHVHGGNSQIVGFYFLEASENCSHVVFHDPRAGKVQIDLPEKDVSTVTYASKSINIQPKPGLMIFTNSWLAHSFTKHASTESIKFVHFNLIVSPEKNNHEKNESVEVI